MNVSAIVVTRGDVDIQPVYDNIAKFIDDIVIWDNSRLPDQKVYGRYCGIDRTTNDYVYTQDDDNIAPVGQILSAYRGEGLMVNAPDDEKPWLAWGAIFPKTMAYLPFKTYLDHFPKDDLFNKWADVIFAEFASPIHRVDFGHEDLPWATAPDRMYQQPNHYNEQEVMRNRCSALITTLASPS